MLRRIPARVVARYQDGRLVKGLTTDFETSAASFHIDTSVEGGSPVQVLLGQLKAVFFVRSLSGDRYYDEDQSFREDLGGTRVEVTFNDREVLRGFTSDQGQDALGFFMRPADPWSNNRRIFVVYRAVDRIRFVDEEPE